VSDHWLVAGVGRSGTTAIYEALQNLSHPRRDFDYFLRTLSVGAADLGSEIPKPGQGLRDHELDPRLWLAAPPSPPPLFASAAQDRSQAHGDFVRGLFKDGRSSLVKIIRGCGRLSDYLELRPRGKDRVRDEKSAGLREFHTGKFQLLSATSFIRPTCLAFGGSWRPWVGPQPTFTTECEAATAWWYEMNRAALGSFVGHEERVFIAPYEAYTSDHAVTEQLLADFLSMEVEEEKADHARQGGGADLEADHLAGR